MTNDQKKTLDKTFEGNGWSRSSSNPNVVLDENKKKKGIWESNETFNWVGSGKTHGFHTTNEKARKSS